MAKSNDPKAAAGMQQQQQQMAMRWGMDPTQAQMYPAAQQMYDYSAYAHHYANGMYQDPAMAWSQYPKQGVSLSLLCSHDFNVASQMPAGMYMTSREECESGRHAWCVCVGLMFGVCM